MEKALFVGLDNSGKTSSIYILERKFSLLSNIRPTIRYNRTSLNILGMELILFDLGGQQKYRKEYFKTPLFSGTEVLYFIIDVQDKDRYDVALSYFEEILQKFKELKEFPQIIILLHKLDPDIRKKQEFKNIVENLKQSFLQICNKYDININIDFFKTTIHDEASIISAFSNGLLKINKKSTVITNILKEFCSKTFSSAILLLDENSFIMGSYANEDNKYLIDICRTIAPRFTITMEKVEDYDIDLENIIININLDSNLINKELEFSEKSNDLNNNSTSAYIFIRSFYIDKNSIAYIVSLSKNKRTISLSLKFLPNLAKNLKNFLESF
ncbi:MAG: ADP-ribosylation factor-like protein [Promethearchaeota archaeon]